MVCLDTDLTHAATADCVELLCSPAPRIYCAVQVFCGELGLQQISRTLLGENSTRQASLARVGVSAGMLPHVEHADGFERYLVRPRPYITTPILRQLCLEPTRACFKMKLEKSSNTDTDTNSEG